MKISRLFALIDLVLLYSTRISVQVRDNLCFLKITIRDLVGNTLALCTNFKLCHPTIDRYKFSFVDVATGQISHS